jgi:lysophospholipase L1-like esterase
MAGFRARFYYFIALLIVFSALLDGCAPPLRQKDTGVSPTPSAETAEPSAGPESPMPAEASCGGLDPIPPDVSLPEETPTPTPTPEEGVYVRQVPEGADVPERTPLDNTFFSDAAFIGNSLIEGLRLFSGITECDYYAATSMSVLGVDSVPAVTLDNGATGTILQGVAQKPYAKVYILLGINEIGCETSYFKDAYGDMLDSIRDSQPDADIYIMSLTPVSYDKSSTSDLFNMTRISAYNKALRELAEEKGCFYLDICSALAGPDGYLPADVTSDGVHFSAAQYAVWAEYLRTHYV